MWMVLCQLNTVDRLYLPVNKQKRPKHCNMCENGVLTDDNTCACFAGWYSFGGSDSGSSSDCSISLLNLEPAGLLALQIVFIPIFSAIALLAAGLFVRLFCYRSRSHTASQDNQSRSDRSSSLDIKRAIAGLCALTALCLGAALIDPYGLAGRWPLALASLLHQLSLSLLLSTFAAVVWHWAHLFRKEHRLARQRSITRPSFLESPCSTDKQGILRATERGLLIAVPLMWTAAGISMLLLLSESLVRHFELDYRASQPAAIVYDVFLSAAFSAYGFGFVALSGTVIAALPYKTAAKHKLIRASRSVGTRAIIFITAWFFSLVSGYALLRDPAGALLPLWLRCGSIAVVLTGEITSFWHISFSSPWIKWKEGRTISPEVNQF
jgi:hypothetical protein